MDSNLLDQDARWRRSAAKRRADDLLESAARGDEEGASHAARLVSATLGPEGLGGASQFEMLGLIKLCAPEYKALNYALTLVMDSFHVKALSDARSRMSALETSVGRFHIWIEQPTRAAYQSLVRAWQKQESDSGEFFAWFRDRALGLPASRLDPYLAQIVAGLHVAGGQLRLAGDIHPGRKDPNLAEMSDEEIRALILRKAKSLQVADKNGDTDLIPVYAPGETKSARTFDAMNRSISTKHAVSVVEDDLFLKEIGGLFAPNLMETSTVMRRAVIEALTREDFERVFRKVGLSREQARFTARVVSGRSVWSDDPAAAKAIVKKRSFIVQAMKEDSVLKYLF
jgi:hypothetical protein